MTATTTRFHAIGRLAMASFVLLAGLLAAPAQANILVAPTRITLEKGQRVGQVTVMNKGNEPVTLRISFINYHMHEDGSLVEANMPRPGEYFADRFLQYSPRRVQLAPGEGQTVRVLARPPSGAAAEYRSHLRFQTEPPARDRSEGGSGGKRLDIELVPLFGVSIPVIVRTGDLTASSSIDSVVIRRDAAGQPLAQFRIARSGERSVYGDIRILHQPRGGQERLVAHARGVAVYTPLRERTVIMPFNMLDGAKLSRGTLRIEYVDHRDERNVLAAEEHEIS